MVLAGDKLYVAASNTNRVTIVSTRTYMVVGSIFVGPYAHAPYGSSPQGLALGPDHHSLYVANAGENAVAVVRLFGGGEAGRWSGGYPLPTIQRL